jgi:excisionase family DNA binding protein
MENEIFKKQSSYGNKNRLKNKNKEEHELGNMQEMLTVKEASKFLHISVNSVYNMVYESRISFYKLKGKILFKRHDLLDFLESCRRPSAAEHIANKGILNNIH